VIQEIHVALAVALGAAFLLTSLLFGFGWLRRHRPRK
jgi:hypothetical protein